MKPRTDLFKLDLKILCLSLGGFIILSEIRYQIKNTMELLTPSSFVFCRRLGALSFCLYP